jgi:hypothetical protein
MEGSHRLFRLALSHLRLPSSLSVASYDSNRIFARRLTSNCKISKITGHMEIRNFSSMYTGYIMAVQDLTPTICTGNVSFHGCTMTP